MLMCSTGMRRSEVLGLRWANLDLDTGKLAVVDTVVPVRNKPTLRLGETKSRRSRRLIALDGRTVVVLREHKVRQNEERLRAGQAWANLDLVFADELGGIFSPDTFTRTTKQLAVEAGVPALTPHSAARHTWATLALSSGVHPKVVQERLGHSSIAITLDRYSHVIDGMDRDAAETVAALIR
jgi:integrase